MQLSDLQNDMTVTFRLGRAGREDVDWEDWQEGKIYVRRRAPNEVLPKRQQSGSWGKGGEIITIVPHVEVSAEYDERDFSNGVFNCEDWYFEIKGLV